MNNNMYKPLVSVKTNDGKYEMLGQLEEIRQEEFENTDLKYSEYCVDLKHNEFEMTVSPIQLTRKKFVKILMSKGIQRNGANEIAKYFLKKRGYYSLVDLISF